MGARTVIAAYGIGLWLLGPHRLRTHLTFRGEAAGIVRATLLADLSGSTLQHRRPAAGTAAQVAGYGVWHRSRLRMRAG